MIYVWILLGLLAVFLAILCIRAVLFKTRSDQIGSALAKAPEINKEKITRDMTALIQCETVSNRDPALEKEEEFQEFKERLNTLFPMVSSRCQKQELGRRGILYHWPAAEGAENWVFMSHYDVVPVNREDWSHDPFGGEVIDGELWGRGTLDTKGTLLGIMEAAEQLLQEGFEPRHNLYFAFSGDEEIFGPSAPSIVDYFEAQGITPDFVLDEGGAVVEKPLPGVIKDAAVVGIAEKGIVNLRLTIKRQGGHASTPPKQSAAGQLAKAILRLEKKGFQPRLTMPAEEMLKALAREGTFPLRLIAANLFVFKPLLFLAAKQMGGELAALLRTTIATTELSGSSAINVMPPEVSCGLNLRILPGETRQSCEEHVRKIVADPEIEVSVIGGDGFGSEPSRVSEIDVPAWETLRSVIQDTWSDTVVAPYLMLAGSDSRHYGRISDKVYRFSPMKLSKVQRGLIHSNDERVPLETLFRTVQFYLKLMRS